MPGRILKWRNGLRKIFNWTKDKKRMERAGVPLEEQKYRTKPELALEIVEQLEGVIEYDWIGGDTLYGNSPQLRKRSRGPGKSYVLDVGESLKVCVKEPQPYIPDASGGRGRKRKKYVIAEETVALKELVKTIDPARWQKITYREGTKGELIREAVLEKVWIWEKATEPVEETYLLISRKTDATEIKYSLCHEADGELRIEKALFRQMQRYWIERGFQEIKQQIGLAQYQVRGWRAWHHHIALTMMALHFILETQLENAEKLPLMSCADVKMMLSQILQNRLDELEVLLETIHQRHRIRKDDILRRR
jgi:SRSO17 transposase